MKKKSIPIFLLVIVLCTGMLTGCGEINIIFAGFNKGNRNSVEGLFSCAVYSRDTNVFDIDNIELDFYFGHKVENPNSDDYNFVSVVAVLVTGTMRNFKNDEYDSYKNIKGVQILREFTPVEFFSDDYAVKRGKWGMGAYAHHEKMIVPKEFTDLFTLDSGYFYFEILGIVFDEESNTYSFTIGEDRSSYHIIVMRYMEKENGKIKLTSNGSRTVGR